MNYVDYLSNFNIDKRAMPLKKRNTVSEVNKSKPVISIVRFECGPSCDSSML